MRIYDEITQATLDPAYVAELVRDGRGRTYPGKIQTGTKPGEPERWEIMPGTAGSLAKNGLRRRIPATPDTPIFEDCLFYHSYTPEELAPTWQESIEAQVLYTALLTDTLLEV